MDQAVWRYTGGKNMETKMTQKRLKNMEIFTNKGNENTWAGEQTLTRHRWKHDRLGGD